MEEKNMNYLISSPHASPFTRKRGGFRILTRERLFLVIVVILGGFAGYQILIGPNSILAKSDTTGPKNDLLQVTFLDVYQGDSILISTPNGKNILIDGGQNSGKYTTFDGGKDVIIPFLKKNNIKKLDVVIMTHPHADHVGGLISILENIPVSEVIEPAIEYTSALYKRFLTLIESKGIRWTEAKEGMILSWGDLVQAQILGPREHYLGTRSDANNSSVIVRLVYGSTSFLFTGDIEEEAERDLEDYGIELKTTVLKVPHHGGEFSSSDDFVRLVRPDIAVIMCGKGNKFGHPSPQTLQEYEKYQTRIYRTDLCGTISMISDGQRISVSTERECK